jgi:hypothetical protein
MVGRHRAVNAISIIGWANELPPQQATGYQDSRLTGSRVSSGELTRFRTEPSSARHGSSVTLVNRRESTGGAAGPTDGKFGLV